jgi:hypothetical protein
MQGAPNPGMDAVEQQPIPTEIRVEAVRDDVIYRLPVRPLGNSRWFGLAPIAFGVLFISGPAKMLIGSLGRLIKDKGAWGEAGFSIFMIPFLVGGLTAIGFGLCIMFGTCSVEWQAGQLSVLDQVGPLWWRRRLMKPRQKLRKFTVGAGAKSNGKPITSGPFAELSTLVAEFEAGKPRFVALGYPKAWLEAIAFDISARIKIASPSSNGPRVEVVDVNAEELPARVVERPPGSDVRLEQGPNGVTLVIPPAGLWKGSKGLFTFGIMWCLFMTVFTVTITYASLKSPHHGMLPFWLFIGAFWCIGAGLLAGAINMGRRRALMVTSGGTLQVAQESIFGKKRWDWPQGEIADIRSGPSGMAVNDRPIIELQMHPVTGKKQGFFAGRDEQELAWMAFELRRALGLDSQAPGRH